MPVVPATWSGCGSDPTSEAIPLHGGFPSEQRTGDATMRLPALL